MASSSIVQALGLLEGAYHLFFEASGDAEKKRMEQRESRAYYDQELVRLLKERRPKLLSSAIALKSKEPVIAKAAECVIQFLWGEPLKSERSLLSEAARFKKREDSQYVLKIKHLVRDLSTFSKTTTGGKLPKGEDGRLEFPRANEGDKALSLLKGHHEDLRHILAYMKEEDEKGVGVILPPRPRSEYRGSDRLTVLIGTLYRQVGSHTSARQAAEACKEQIDKIASPFQECTSLASEMKGLLTEIVQRAEGRIFKAPGALRIAHELLTRALAYDQDRTNKAAHARVATAICFSIDPPTDHTYVGLWNAVSTCVSHFIRDKKGPLYCSQNDFDELEQALKGAPHPKEGSEEARLLEEIRTRAKELRTQAGPLRAPTAKFTQIDDEKQFKRVITLFVIALLLVAIGATTVVFDDLTPYLENFKYREIALYAAYSTFPISLTLYAIALILNSRRPN